MTVEAANDYLSSNEGVLNAFEVPSKWHFTVGQTVESVKKSDWIKVAQATSDFFTTGVGYLANRGADEYLQEIGTTTWWAVNQNRVLTMLTDNMPISAIQLGVPPKLAVTTYATNDEPHLLFMGKYEGKNLIESAYILMPPEFIVRAQNNAVEGMAIMAYICSQVRDLINGRLSIDQDEINPRAWATESHFLQLAIKQHPQIVVSEVFQEVIRRYPNGLKDLPSGSRYRGVSGEEFRNASKN